MGHASMGPIDQIGYVVANLDTSIARWTRRTGLAPWTVFRNSRLEGMYRGSSTGVILDVALAYQGGVQIELIEVRSDTPSPYAQSGRLLTGIHHVAWVVDDLDRSITAAEERGLVAVFTAANAAVRVAYLESPGEQGVLYELIEGQGMREMIAAGVAASAQWDGTDPVNEIDLAAGAA